MLFRTLITEYFNVMQPSVANGMEQWNVLTFTVIEVLLYFLFQYDQLMLIVVLFTKSTWKRLTRYVVSTVFQLYGCLNMNKQLAGLSKLK